MKPLLRVQPPPLLVSVLSWCIWAAAAVTTYVLTGSAIWLWILVGLSPLLLLGEVLSRRMAGTPQSRATARQFRTVVETLEPRVHYRNSLTGDVFFRLTSGRLMRRETLVVTHDDDLSEVAESQDARQRHAVTWQYYWVTNSLDQVFTESDGDVIDAPDSDHDARPPVAASPSKRPRLVRQMWIRLKHVQHLQAPDAEVDDLVSRLREAYSLGLPEQED